MTQINNSDTNSESNNYTDTYTTRYGRKYNAATNYLLPMDEGDRSSSSIRRVYRDHQTPIKEQLEKGINVLDSACGAGAHWTLTMKKQYPNCVYTGVDISNVFPAEKYSNINFVMGNISKRIPTPDEYFDFAFQKLLGLAFTREEWDSNLKELYRVLKHGGYVELSEIYAVSACNTGPLMDQVMNAFKTISKSKAIIVDKAPYELEHLLTKAGFTNPMVIIRNMPLNHGEHGKLYWKCMRAAYEILRPQFAQVYPEWNDVSFFEDFLNSAEEECSVTK
ncbi:hypothetical protein INT47_011464, partial [Mucor saturninus]